jgi:hydrogenase maturation factor
MTAQVAAGHRLFAQYAFAPNALGYCGPQGSAALREVACGSGARVDVQALARRFSGAWPYQQVLAELAGPLDALDERVVRAYWTGNDLTDQVDRATFGAVLLERIRTQAGRYWDHLDDALLVEAAPTHSFHVLGVYPWSRLLSTGQPEPLGVLDSCRIGWATVVGVEPDRLTVRSRHLEYADRVLTLGAEREESVGYRVDGAAFVDAVAAGDQVAVHWGFACDRLTAEQVESLERWTLWQLEAMAPRLAVG